MPRPETHVKGKNWLTGFFYFLWTAVTVRLLVRVYQNIEHVRFENFGNAELLSAFLLSFFTYLSVLAIAVLIHKTFPWAGAAIVYFFVFAFLYFLTLCNLLTFQLADAVFIRSTFFVILVSIIIKLVLKNKNATYQKQCPWPWWQWILTAVWFIHSLLLTLQKNLDPGREPYADEWGIWYKSAEAMILDGVFAAHLKSYINVGLHTFGVPFIAALPAKLGGNLNTHSVYFLPLAVIFGITIALCEMKERKWAFLYFVVALFVTFNNRSWVRQLTYAYTYGEGIAMVFFLAVSMFVYRLSLRESLSFPLVLMSSFIIGLAALTKSPLSLIHPLYFIFLMALFLRKRKEFLWAIPCLIVYLLPYVLWKTFHSIHGLADESTAFEVNFHILMNPNVPMLKAAWHNMSTDAENLVYFVLLSFGLIAVAGSRRLYAHVLPIVIFVAGIVFYYAYLYNYGKEGDFASSLRYLMPMSLALFYLGGLAFDRILDKIRLRGWHPGIKLAAAAVCAGLFIHKLF